MKYEEFISKKIHLEGDFGFTPSWIPDNAMEEAVITAMQTEQVELF